MSDFTDDITWPDEDEYYAEEGDPCEGCGIGEYVIRTNKKTDEEFLGCSRFPDCRSTKRLRI